MERLAEPLIVGEKKGFVLLDGASNRNTELISLERRRGRTRIVEVARVQCVISQKLVHRAMPLIRARLRDDGDLASRLLAILRVIRVAQEVELAHRVDAE